MGVSDWLETVSLLMVAVALLLGALQLREIGRQSGLLVESARHAAYEASNAYNNEYCRAFLKDNPAMLQWHLSRCGYATADELNNEKILYLLIRLDTHERNYLNWHDRLMTDEIWAAWKAVLDADLATPEFDSVWQVAQRFYVPSFVEAVNEFRQRRHRLLAQNASHASGMRRT